MSAVTLTEQMGAMALIDELRHAQIEVQKHLDLPVRRQAVAARIREYYQAKGIEFDDSLVDQGVREYFASRLTYEAPKVGLLSGLFARVFITRSQWSKPALLALALSLTTGLGGIYAVHRYDAYQVSKIQEHVESLRHLSAGIIAEVKKQELLADQVEAGLSELPPAASVRFVAMARERMPTVKSQANVTLPAAVSEANREQAAAQTEDAAKSLKQAKEGLEVVQQSLGGAKTIASASKDLANIISSPENQAALSLPLIQQAYMAANEALSYADLTRLDQAKNAVSNLDAVLSTYRSMRPMADDLANLRLGITSMKLPSSDAAQFAPMLAAAEAGISNLDPQQTSASIADAKALMAFAAMPLSLDVVSRANRPSMIERNYDPSGGKTWYLLTEATDKAGNVIPVRIQSSETGKTKLVNVFGVRVTEEQFNAAYDDKKADGHVDDHAMGHKPANSLSLTFERAVIGKPDMITEW